MFLTAIFDVVACHVPGEVVEYVYGFVDTEKQVVIIGEILF